MYQILLVEDDRTIVTMLSDFLKKEGMEVTAAAGQRRAMELLSERDFDLALLDISLEDGNGYGLCRQIRELKDLPVIFVTASSDEYSIITGLDLGADDYIAKPFRPRELASRIRSVLRRYGRAQSVIELGDVRVDTVKAEVRKDGRELNLSALEYRLLLVFLNNRGIVLSRNRLLSEIWDIAGDYVNDNTLTVYIKRLRDKIEDDPANPALIRTVRGLGYKVD